MDFNHQMHYLYPEIIGQIHRIKEKYICSELKTEKGIVTCNVLLQPTECSSKYTVQLKAQIGMQIVRVHVLDPQLRYAQGNNSLPHVYYDKSLCLYYPKINEWSYMDSWADTIIPWTSLWLYYYEIWLQTGEWLGGGTHSPSKK